MESCDERLRLENRLRAASEHYAELIVQHRQIMRDGKPDASTLDSTLKNARRRRNTAGRLLMDHWINHAALSRPKTKDSGPVLTGAAVQVSLRVQIRENQRRQQPEIEKGRQYGIL